MVVRLAIVLYALLESPSNVRSMAEMRRASPWLWLGKFLDFLGGRKSK
jgi:hypothetical protein